MGPSASRQKQSQVAGGFVRPQPHFRDLARNRADLAQGNARMERTPRTRSSYQLLVSKCSLLLYLNRKEIIVLNTNLSA